jgi:energy-coupling factor transporter ATP-binding protein EcfA2
MVTETPPGGAGFVTISSPTPVEDTTRPSPLATHSDELPLWQIGIVAVAAGLIATTGGRYIGQWLQSRRQPSPGPGARLVEATSQPIYQSTNLPAEPTTTHSPEGGLPTLFIAEGARILIVGPSRSGKSTVLHHLLSRALPDTSFDEIILLDGKGSELEVYAQVPGAIYHGPDQIEDWIPLLRDVASDMPLRYTALKGKRLADEGAPRKLVVIDEVQRATRSKYGRELTESLLLIAEQSGALRDVFILTTQRAKHRTLSKDIAYNASLIVQLLSATRPGYFEVRTSIDSRSAQAISQAKLADDNDIAAWAAAAAQARTHHSSLATHH